MVKVIHNKSLCLLFLVGLFLSASNAFADNNTTDFSITVNPSLSLSVSSSTVGFEITPTQAGAYNSSSFNVYSSTNNATGYTLTMSTGKVNLESNTINPNTGSKPTIPTLTETQDGITAAQFEASTDSNVLNHYGVAIGANNYNAMKLEKEIKKTSANNTTEDTTAIALASKLDLLTVPGVYSTTLNFSLVANPTTPVPPFIDPDPDPNNDTVHPCAKMGDLECDDTDGDGVGDSLVFPANSLLRTYEIAYTNAGKPMYVEDSNTDIGWRPMTAADEATIGGKEVRFAIQDISMTLDDTANSNNVCEAAATSTSDRLYKDEAPVMDLRDGKTYWIAKLADAYCWTLDNLALDPTDNVTASNMSSTNTNATDDAINNLLYGGNSGSVAGWSSVAISDDWVEQSGYNDGSWIKYTEPLIHTDRINEKVDASLDWKTGVFYNYCAVSVSTYCYPENQTYDEPNSAIDSRYDLCPLGWRLPTGGEYNSDTEIWQMALTYKIGEDYRDSRVEFHVPLSGSMGYYRYDAGSQVEFWTSTITSRTHNMYATGWWGNSMYVGSKNDRFYGNPVRCIAK